MPILSVVACTVLMFFLTVETWLRFLVWMLLGFAVYFLYSRHHSRLERAEGPNDSLPGQQRDLPTGPGTAAPPPSG